eukprot:6288365-Amphidinium_carterae.1
MGPTRTTSVSIVLRRETSIYVNPHWKHKKEQSPHKDGRVPYCQSQGRYVCYVLTNHAVSTLGKPVLRQGIPGLSIITRFLLSNHMHESQVRAVHP